MAYPGYAEALRAADASEQALLERRALAESEAALRPARQPLSFVQAVFAIFTGNLLTAAVVVVLYLLLH